MPLQGFRCPPGSETPGQRNALDFCLGACAAPCVAPPLLAAIYKADVGNYHRDDYISASMLTGSGCERQTFFERYEPFYEEPKRRYWAFRGTHAHSIIEGAQDMVERHGFAQEIRMATTLQYPEHAAPCFETIEHVRTAEEMAALEMAEQEAARGHAAAFFNEHELTFDPDLFEAMVERLARPVDEVWWEKRWTGDFDSSACLEVTVRGTADVVNPYTRTIFDFKTMSDSKVAGFIKRKTQDDGTVSGLQPSWILQLNIYRWLVARTPIPEDLKQRWVALGLPYLKQRTFPAPTKLVIQAVAPMEIPHSGGQYSFKAAYRPELFDVDAIPVLPLQEIEKIIRPRVFNWYRYLVLRQKPPVVSADKRWICKSCAFRDEICFPDQETE